VEPRFDRDGLPLLRELRRGELVQDPSLRSHARDDVRSLGVDPDVRLAEDRLGPHGRGHEDASVGHGEFEQGEFLRSFAFPLQAVVVPDGRLVPRAPDDRMLVDPHVATFAELAELPLHEGIVGRVQLRGDEGPPPIDGGPEGLQVLDGGLGEDLDPVHRVRELRDLCPGDAHLPQDAQLDRLALRDPLRGPQDGQAGAMERLGMEDVVTGHAAVAGLEFRTQEGNAEAEVLEPGHVGIGDVCVPLRPARVGVGLEDPCSAPSLLPFHFNRSEVQARPPYPLRGLRTASGHARSWGFPSRARGRPRFPSATDRFLPSSRAYGWPVSGGPANHMPSGASPPPRAGGLLGPAPAGAGPRPPGRRHGRLEGEAMVKPFGVPRQGERGHATRPDDVFS